MTKTGTTFGRLPIVFEIQVSPDFPICCENKKFFSLPQFSTFFSQLDKKLFSRSLPTPISKWLSHRVKVPIKQNCRRKTDREGRRNFAFSGILPARFLALTSDVLFFIMIKLHFRRLRWRRDRRGIA